MQNDAPTDTILIVDFGSQVTQLIARRVRETGVYCEIHPFSTAVEKLDVLKPKGIILSGGPASVIEEAAPQVDPKLLDYGVPVVGICYGQQAMCVALGGVVEPGYIREFGRAEVRIEKDCALYDGVWELDHSYQVWMSHGDKVSAIPEGFEAVGTSPGAPFAIIANEERKFYGVQFHPEVVHTPDGAKLYAQFVHAICGCEASWTMAAYREQAIAAIRKQVGDKKVICGLSGGVDSSVAATLTHQAIGGPC